MRPVILVWWSTAHYSFYARDDFDMEYTGRGNPVEWSPRRPDIIPLAFIPYREIQKNGYIESLKWILTN